MIEVVCLVSGHESVCYIATSLLNSIAILMARATHISAKGGLFVVLSGVSYDGNSIILFGHGIIPFREFLGTST
jgi:hypothetical protein